MISDCGLAGRHTAQSAIINPKSGQVFDNLFDDRVDAIRDTVCSLSQLLSDFADLLHADSCLRIAEGGAVLCSVFSTLPFFHTARSAHCLFPPQFDSAARATSEAATRRGVPSLGPQTRRVAFGTGPPREESRCESRTPSSCRQSPRYPPPRALSRRGIPAGTISIHSLCLGPMPLCPLPHCVENHAPGKVASQNHLKLRIRNTFFDIHCPVQSFRAHAYRVNTAPSSVVSLSISTIMAPHWGQSCPASAARSSPANTPPFASRILTIPFPKPPHGLETPAQAHIVEMPFTPYAGQVAAVHRYALEGSCNRVAARSDVRYSTRSSTARRA